VNAPRVGFVGLGNMGRPMAGRLVGAGFPTTVFDVDRGTLARFVEEFPADAAGDLGVLGGQCDLVITMLPTGQIVREVLLGPGGAAHAMRPGSVVVDMSSSSPTGTVRLGAELLPSGIALVDAPVSGGPPGAATGSLSIMVGADGEETIERARPYLEALGAKLLRTGGLGTGHAAKAINNFIAASIVSATSEGLILGQRFGLDPEALLAVINASSGRSAPSETLFPSQVLTGTFSFGFAIGLMAKDVGLAGELARELEASLPFCELTEATWTEARDALGADTDFTAIFRRIEALSRR
jgi:3-hydroxyisobutyrate dehydrogenase